MIRLIESDKRYMCASGTFLQMADGINVVPHKNDMVWVFGKIYRRSFINKYNIRFNETRANEDTGFNTKIKLICSYDDSESICFFDVPVYYWHEKVDSITRVNNCQYSFDQSFCGWTAIQWRNRQSYCRLYYESLHVLYRNSAQEPSICGAELGVCKEVLS